MIKTHCDRCDAPGALATDSVEISRTILEDKGIDRDFGVVNVEFRVRTADGNGQWIDVDLCHACRIEVVATALRELCRQTTSPVNPPEVEALVSKVRPA